MYHLMKRKKGVFISQVTKRFPRMRRRKVYEEMTKEIKNGKVLYSLGNKECNNQYLFLKKLNIQD